MTTSTPSPEPSHTVASALRLAALLGIDRFDAQLLLGHLLGKGRAWLIAHDDEALPTRDGSALPEPAAAPGRP